MKIIEQNQLGLFIATGTLLFSHSVYLEYSHPQREWLLPEAKIFEIMAFVCMMSTVVIECSFSDLCLINAEIGAIQILSAGALYLYQARTLSNLSKTILKAGGISLTLSVIYRLFDPKRLSPKL